MKLQCDKNRQSVNNLTIFIVIFYAPFYLWPKIEGNVTLASLSFLPHPPRVSLVSCPTSAERQSIIWHYTHVILINSCTRPNQFRDKNPAYLNSSRSSGLVVHSSHYHRFLHLPRSCHLICEANNSYSARRCILIRFSPKKMVAESQCSSQSSCLLPLEVPCDGRGN